jgi:hypothetical protein
MSVRVRVTRSAQASWQGELAALPGEGAGRADAERVTIRRLSDQEAQNATSDRTYRIVADPGTGLRSAT